MKESSFLSSGTGVAGVAGGTAVTAALVGARGGDTQEYRIVTDNYIRVEFGPAGVTATSASELYAPGREIKYRQNEASPYCSVLCVDGSANYSVTPGRSV